MYCSSESFADPRFRGAWRRHCYDINVPGIEWDLFVLDAEAPSHAAWVASIVRCISCWYSDYSDSMGAEPRGNRITDDSGQDGHSYLSNGRGMATGVF